MMNIDRCQLPSFAVIGKEGSTKDGEGFVAKLWNEANAHFDEVKPLAAIDEEGNMLGVWGAMTDFSRSFLPWEENFSQGLYLAGVQCEIGQQPPEGWSKWIIPAYEYLYVECGSSDLFSEMIQYLQTEHIPLAGAVHEFICPKTGKSYLFFPIRRL